MAVPFLSPYLSVWNGNFYLLLGVWLKAKVFGHRKGELACLGFILCQPFSQGQHFEKNVTTWLKEMLVCKHTCCGFYDFTHFFTPLDFLDKLVFWTCVTLK